YPQPTSPGLLNNLVYSQHTYINGDQGDARIDYNISDSDRMFGRYSQSSYTNPTINTGAPLLYNGFANYPTHTGMLDWVHNVGPALVNEARVGVNYVFINNGSATNTVPANFAQSVGIPDVPSAFLPSMSLSGGNVSSFGTSDIYQLFADTTIQAGDSVILTMGTHTMHFGFQAMRYRLDTFYSGNNGRAGTILFNGQYTAGPAPGTKAGNGSGLAEADFLLGLPDEVQGGINGGTWGQRSSYFAAFYQDDWRVTPNLTLNLGLRWEVHTPWVEVHNRQANFDLVTGQESIAGQNGASRALYNQYNGITNFQPRVGFAFTPGGGKTVIRAGYTLSNYLEGTGTNLRLPLNPPFAVEHDNLYTGTAYNVLPGSTLDQGFIPFVSSAGDQFHSATLRVWDPFVRPAVSNQWNVVIERQLSNASTISAAYVGERSTHLMVPMPYFQKYMAPNGAVSGTWYLAGNQALLSDIGNISGTASIGNADYDALQIMLNQRLSDGLQFQANYTYSKCMTNNQGYYGQGGQAGQSNWYYQNLYDAAAEWGPCDYDATNILTGNFIYDLPFGRGRRFGKSMNKVLDAFVGGWKVAGIVSLHTGFAMTITASDASNTLSRGARADCIAPADVLGAQNSPKGGYQWFSPDGFAQPADGTFGSCGVGTVRGPGLAELDGSVSKDFNITESQHIELRGEFVNLTNTPILNSPTRGVGTNLGLLQSAQGERNVQLALKYMF
ncbi:MAG TPA: carboxypeptidase regulatory-like domain-containing protein, partial [Bryobacteraceae bacterium]